MIILCVRVWQVCVKSISGVQFLGFVDRVGWCLVCGLCCCDLGFLCERLALGDALVGQ